MSNDFSDIRALTFDVFGTVVDWRSSVIRELEVIATNIHVEIDAEEFADEWRSGYPRIMQEVRDGLRPWDTIDVLHRVILEELIPRYGLERLSEDERTSLNRVWHRLIPWPDSVEGLMKLKTKYVIATLSNGNVALLVDMAKHAAHVDPSGNGLPWDLVFSAELFGHFTPAPEVYLGAARLLDLAPDQVMMVATHAGDLRAAASIGFRTAYVDRPIEWGISRAAAEKRSGDEFDIEVDDFLELATMLGIE